MAIIKNSKTGQHKAKHKYSVAYEKKTKIKKSKKMNFLNCLQVYVVPGKQKKNVYVRQTQL